MDEHFKSIISKAAAGQSILAKVADSHWGLEVSTMHITHDAVMNSLLCYALAITGSVFPPDLVWLVNTQVINVAARKVGGVSRTARIENSHFVINTATYMNLYVVHCAVFMAGCMRARTSNIHKRMVTE